MACIPPKKNTLKYFREQIVTTSRGWTPTTKLCPQRRHRVKKASNYTHTRPSQWKEFWFCAWRLTLIVTESGPERSIDEAPLEVLCVYLFPIIAFPKHFIVTEDFLKKVLRLWRRRVLSILQEGRGRGSMLLACVTEDTWVSEEVRSGFLSSPIISCFILFSFSIIPFEWAMK